MSVFVYLCIGLNAVIIYLKSRLGRIYIFHSSLSLINGNYVIKFVVTLVGTKNNGTYRTSDFYFHRNTTNGLYTMENFTITDQYANIEYYNQTKLQQLGFLLSLNVISPYEDNDPPVFLNFTIIDFISEVIVFIIILNFNILRSMLYTYMYMINLFMV